MPAPPGAAEQRRAAARCRAATSMYGFRISSSSKVFVGSYCAIRRVARPESTPPGLRLTVRNRSSPGLGFLARNRSLAGASTSDRPFTGPLQLRDRPFTVQPLIGPAPSHRNRPVSGVVFPSRPVPAVRPQKRPSSCSLASSEGMSWKRMSRGLAPCWRPTMPARSSCIMMRPARLKPTS